ncbi:MAG: bifunctional oligoribonuclease/PAP phosphatase NrnA [Oscillospiraceae bacterium]|nr:bifunctional oligoribonuclease/PAP phosphatase NrnA [Oscillospiraceae bacterium]MBQ8732077.1 bifunctional oligoribonuclease/PAP phosphatase NrnA [Oscillospiraceae bacterium]
MSEQISQQEAALLLRQGEDILVLCHEKPDGDTIGSGTALCAALAGLGKRVALACSDPIPDKYRYMGFERFLYRNFTPKMIVAVDVADAALLGNRLGEYKDQVDLCIDHHGSNRAYAKKCWVEGGLSATCEMIYRLVRELGCEMTTQIAACCYTGISTDTGCFRYSSVTPATHRIAAEILEFGVDGADINRRMFECKSRSRLAVELAVLSTIEYYCEGKCAVITVTRDILEQCGAVESELEGIPPIPKQIEGVEVGITIREREDCCRISLRTGETLDASAVCALFGGGGHIRASGCTIPGTPAQAKAALIAAVEGLLSNREQD